MPRISFLLTVSLLALTGCTLTPPRGGDDLLDTDYKAEHQDPVKVFAGPYTHTVPAHGAQAKPLAVRPAVLEKGEPKIPEPVKEKETATSPTPSAAAEKEEKIVQNETVKNTPPATKKITAKDCAVKDTQPPAAPTAQPKMPAFKSGDIAKVTVFRENDLTGSYTVDEKGMITYPLLGKISAAGMTASELQQKIQTELSKGYIVKPEVRVEFATGCNH